MLNSSVEAVADGLRPPKAKPAVCVPAPPTLFLAVPKLPPDAHAAAVITFIDLAYSSVMLSLGPPVTPGFIPP